MFDRKKVIEQLESMRDYHRSAGNNITAEIANDAVALLKEQEPAPPEIATDARTGSFRYYVCGGCGGEISVNDMYCKRCGRGIEWKQKVAK